MIFCPVHSVIEEKKVEMELLTKMSVEVEMDSEEEAIAEIIDWFRSSVVTKFDVEEEMTVICSRIDCISEFSPVMFVASVSRVSRDFVVDAVDEAKEVFSSFTAFTRVARIGRSDRVSIPFLSCPTASGIDSCMFCAEKPAYVWVVS